MKKSRNHEGCFVAVVGPSGAGKDTVLNNARGVLRNDSRFHFAQRTITRPASGGNENHISIDELSFQRAVRENAFSLHWQAHGLYYGLASVIEAELDQGCVVIANLSRRVLNEARERFNRFCVVKITAKPEILAERLAQRGRESHEEIIKRLSRVAPANSVVENVVTIDNSGDISRSTDRFVAHLLDLCEG